MAYARLLAEIQNMLDQLDLREMRKNLLQFEVKAATDAE